MMRSFVRILGEYPCLRNRHGILLNSRFITTIQTAIQETTLKPKICAKVLVASRCAKSAQILIGRGNKRHFPVWPR